MAKRKLRGALAMAVAMVALFAAFPLIRTHLDPKDVAGLLAPRQSEYKGVIQIWQLSNFNASYGSKLSLLSAAADRVEWRYAGVYFEIKSLTQEDYRQRTALGEFPDMLSFSSNWEADSVYFADMSQYSAMLREPFAGFVQNMPRAVPWMADSKVMLANQALAGSAPQCAKAEDLLAHMATFAPGRRRQTYALSAGNTAWLAAIQAQTPTDALAGEAVQAPQWQGMDNQSAWRQFRAGQSAYFIGDRSHMITMEALQGQGKGFAFSVLDWPEDWNTVINLQYLAILNAADSGKRQACDLFVAELLSSRQQTKLLEDMGSIPVIEMDVEAMSETDRLVYQSAQNALALAPFCQVGEEDIARWVQDGYFALPIIGGE